MPYRKNVTVRATAADDAGSDSRNERMMPKFFPFVDVRDMDLENRECTRIQSIEHGDGGVREGSWIDYYSCRATPSLVNPVNELEFGIGLAELDFQTQFSSCAPAFAFYVRQCFAPIKLGLPAAKQIQIWAVQNVDYRPHFF
jgi:hypothetical protein